MQPGQERKGIVPRPCAPLWLHFAISTHEALGTCASKRVKSLLTTEEKGGASGSGLASRQARHFPQQEGAPPHADLDGSGRVIIDILAACISTARIVQGEHRPSRGQVCTIGKCLIEHRLWEGQRPDSKQYIHTHTRGTSPQ